MALNPMFIPAFSLEEVFLDKDTGLPLSGGIVTFYEDEQRNVLKPVYQLTGVSPNYTYTVLPNPMILALNGTFQDSLNNPVVPYFFPFDNNGNEQLYYVTFESSGLVPQFVREAVPYLVPGITPTAPAETHDNQLINPQFVEVSFNPDFPVILSVSSSNQVSPIAPNWDIVTSGTGTVTISQVALTATNTPSNPPYVLDIQSSGISSLQLRQRIYASPRLFSGDFISATFIAESQDSGVPILTLSYEPSAGTLDNTIIIQNTVDNSGYSTLSGTLEITGILNTDAAPSGYVDIVLDIPIGAHIRVSSFQLVSTTEGVDVNFNQQSTPQQINSLFQYYKNSILVQPKDTFLVGWDFPFNPWQFSNPAGATLASAAPIYTADNTLLFAASGANQVSFKRASYVYDYAFQVSALTNTNRHMLIQYIPAQTAIRYWGYICSSLVKAQLLTVHGTTCRIKMRLIYRNTSIPVVSSTEPVASWTGVDPVFAAGWTSIAPVNDPAYELSTSIPMHASFNGFQLPIASTDNMYLGICLYTIDDLNSSGTADAIVYSSVSLTPNEFAIDTNPKTYDQVLQECQVFFETSYDPGVLIGSTGEFSFFSSSQIAVNGQIAAAAKGYPGMFEIQYRNVKCLRTPQTKFYSPTTGTVGNVSGVVFANGVVDNTTDAAVSTYWSPEYNGQKGIVLEAASSSPFITGLTTGVSIAEAFIQFHWTCNSNLGAF